MGRHMNEYVLDEFQRVKVEQWLWNRQDPRIRDLLSGLSYNPRRLIELRYGLKYGHRYSLEETARVFGKPVDWVKTIEAFALFQLYQFLVPAGRL